MGETGFWRHRNVLITGCTGLVGGWLTKALLAEGAAVVGLVRDWVPQAMLNREGLADRIVTVSGELEDLGLLERVMNEYEIDCVFHLAAQTIVGTANRNPISTFESNIRGTWNLLEACRRSPTVARIVVASSDKAYGNQEELPYTETTPLQGRHPYDVSKSCADLIAASYATTYDLPVCVTRCGNFYGGGDLNFNRIVPGTIRSVLHDERPVIRSDGSYIRDYFYVKDGASAYMQLAAKMSDNALVGEAFNFSNEIQISVLDLVRKILSVMGREDLEPEILGKVANEIPHQYLSAEKARSRLGWTPSYDLGKGLEETVEWYRSFFSA